MPDEGHPNPKVPESAENLERALSALHCRLTGTMHFPDTEVDAMAAANALLRCLVTQAEAILTLSKTQFAEAGISNLRTMFEAWSDLRLILGEGDRNEKGRRFRIFGLFELRDYAANARSSDDDYEKEISDINALILGYREAHPDLVATIEAERTRNSQFWSGKTRSAMLRSLEKIVSETRGSQPGTYPTLLDMYKVMSWDSHNVVTGVLDVTIDKDEEGEIRVGFGHRQSQAESSDFNSFFAERLLADAWIHFTRTFNIEA